jgi:amino acid transporter/biotin operon repressor
VAKAKKFGTFGGVFTPSILTIVGVILYLRLPWIVGQAGLWATLGIVLIAHIISISTGLSVSSVATDKKVGVGGGYYIISRSLGLPIGGTMGLALFVGFSFSISLYLIGFSETFLSYFGFEVSLQTIRLVGSITLFLVAAITFISTSLAIKSQYFILTIIGLSLLSIFIGNHDFTPSVPVLESMDGALPWITLFAIFFPAATGFMAGVSMSGDLRDARKSIPVGTIAAIVVGLMIYVGLVFFLAFTIDRESLVNNPDILFDASWLPQLVVAGILGATLSSALGSILGAPRILQAVAIDRIIPRFFAKGYGASNEPRNALLLTYLIAQAGILIGELNVIARIVSIFFILTYGFLNITYAIESWASSDFRPSFKIPRIVSIIGALACIVVMILLDLVALLVASVVLIALFLFLKRKELTLQTGDTWNSVWTSLVKTGLEKLTITSHEPRNWRPNVILFSGGELNRPHLIEMGKSLVGKLGIFTNFELIEDPKADGIFREHDKNTFNTPVTKKQGVFTRRHHCHDFYEGIDLISRVYGFSGFEPNTIFMGWGRKTRNPEKFAQLLENFKKQDYNTVFLNYNAENGFGKYKQIDFWWTGSGRNLSLALTLLRFITSSKEWMNASLRILVINQDSSKTESLYMLVNQLLDQARLQARVKVINNGVEQLPEAEVILAESSDTDLSILELPEALQKGVTVIEKTNELVIGLKTCLLIRASSFFEEVNLSPGRKIKEKDPAAMEKHTPDVLAKLTSPTRQIVAKEVFKVGETMENLTKVYYSEAYEAVSGEVFQFYSELALYSGKIIDQLKKILKTVEPAAQPKAFLRVLNDFSFQARKRIDYLKRIIVHNQEQHLETANTMYVRDSKAMLASLPEFLRIQLDREEFEAENKDHFWTRTYKALQRFKIRLTGRKVTKKIRVSEVARYFLYLRRMEVAGELMNDYAIDAFGDVVALRKIFISMHEIIEMTRLEAGDKDKALEKLSLEKDRIKAQISVLESEARAFRIEAGNKLFDNLLEDLQQFSNFLDNAGTDPRMKKYLKALVEKKQEQEATFMEMPVRWEKSMNLFINKGVLDFMFLSLRSRIHSKIRKYNLDFSQLLEARMFRPLKAYQSELLEALETSETGAPVENQLDQSLLKNPQVLELYEGFFQEVNELMAELPEEIEISGQNFFDAIEKGALPEPEPVAVNVRKLSGFYLSSLLIDKVKEQGQNTEYQLQLSATRIKDLLRLINFSLLRDVEFMEGSEKEGYQEETAKLLKDFIGKLKEEEGKSRAIQSGFFKIFDEGLRQSFEPLSSAVINQTSLDLKKKMREKGNGQFSRWMNRQINQISETGQKNLVNLLYSKSEGIVWANRFEKSQTGKLANRDLLGFVEAVSPRQQIMKELPYYYATLFSGLSGTSDDFWVGMHEQIAEGNQAIARFKSGIPGALIISGERSSGKSSLSKYLARKHFSQEHVHIVRAPKSCEASLEVFREALAQALHVQPDKLLDVMTALPAGKVIIIHDLELWWERKTGGLQVIEWIKELIGQYGKKFLFLININEHALKVLEKSTGLLNYSLAAVVCKPFDARELHDLIMLRHHAGGLKFVYHKKEEERMTAWDFARMFNRFFDQSYGNPGLLISLWLSSIKKISARTIYMEPIQVPPDSVFDVLTHEQLFYLLQFIMHRRHSIESLAESLQTSEAVVKARLDDLSRAGLIIEKFEGVYAIHPSLDIYLVEKLKSKNLL